MMAHDVRLRTDAIDAQPIDVDWAYGWGETWEIVYPDWDLSRGEIYHLIEWEGIDAGEPLDDIPDHALVDLLNDWALDWGHDNFDPMMNFAYPLPEIHNVSILATRLVLESLPLTVIEHSTHGTVMALTGGGMDLSWEICTGYVVAGYYPPTHFASRLPRMAWGTVPERFIETARAAVRSCEIAWTRAETDLEDARNILAWWIEEGSARG